MKAKTKKRIKNSFILIVLIGVLLLSAIIGILIGSVPIKVSDIMGVFKYELFKIGEFEQYGKGAIHDIIWLIRVPRVILGMAIGISLSISGVVMQAIVKNPLADPYILGISSGASLGATLAVLVGVGAAFGANAIGVCAFIGAVGTSILVLLVANIKGRSNSIRLLLGGMAISAISSAFTSFIVYMSNNAQGMKTITFWLMGDLSGAKWENITIFLPATILAIAFFITQTRILNMMLLGDEVSLTLGRDLLKFRHVYLIVTSFLIGFAVYSAGVIGFVGLIIPHLVRMISGTDHKTLIPFCALTGAIFIIVADLVCRIILPVGELPIGILISIIGAPAFIILLLTKNYGFGGNE